MKKRNVRIIWGVTVVMLISTILFIDAVGAVAIFDHYVTRKSQKDLSFSFNSCKRTGNINKNTILSKKWESETLVVTGIVFPDCMATWLFGSYELDGNKMSLKYSPVALKNLASACDCPTDVRYVISGLKKVDYDVTLIEGDYVEYTSLLYRLFY